MTVQSTCLAKIVQGEPSSSYECTPEAESTMVRPSVISSAAQAMTRWNDVIGRPSQAPNRARGPCRLGWADFAAVSAASLPVSLPPSAAALGFFSSGACGPSGPALPRRSLARMSGM
ncbi:Uncharacterised protein [Mycobacteroides abscessus subsp. abscessus]|nr:Uncharacterised protein [Mycobacteroides abscessus subsp. abscessus]